MKDLNYWKNNAEEDYINTPISVLRYITELEKVKENKQLILSDVSQQRELLLLFKKWEQEAYYKPYDGDAELMVDTYLKSNCG